jgi:hypothetical protein
MSLLSCLFYFRVSSSLQAEGSQSKTFELQNENFELAQELEESDLQLYECGTTVGGGGASTETLGEGVLRGYSVCIYSVSSINVLGEFL